jgi:hypothetical protein
VPIAPAPSSSHFRFPFSPTARGKRNGNSASNSVKTSTSNIVSALKDDGLSQRWSGKVFLNPPYGRQTGRWVRKAFEESLNGVFVVCLLPARTDTRWWQDYAKRGHVYFLRGRLRFGNAVNTAPFPSAIVTFGRFFSM